MTEAGLAAELPSSDGVTALGLALDAAYAANRLFDEVRFAGSAAPGHEAPDAAAEAAATPPAEEAAKRREFGRLLDMAAVVLGPAAEAADTENVTPETILKNMQRRTRADLAHILERRGLVPQPVELPPLPEIDRTQPQVSTEQMRAFGPAAGFSPKETNTIVNAFMLICRNRGIPFTSEDMGGRHTGVRYYTRQWFTKDTLRRHVVDGLQEPIGDNTFSRVNFLAHFLNYAEDPAKNTPPLPTTPPPSAADRPDPFEGQDARSLLLDAIRLPGAKDDTWVVSNRSLARFARLIGHKDPAGFGALIRGIARHLTGPLPPSRLPRVVNAPLSHPESGAILTGMVKKTGRAPTYEWVVTFPAFLNAVDDAAKSGGVRNAIEGYTDNKRAFLNNFVLVVYELGEAS